jgi:hypothetical protein
MAKHGFLRRYTELGPVLYLLQKRMLTLLSPRLWDDSKGFLIAISEDRGKTWTLSTVRELLKSQERRERSSCRSFQISLLSFHCPLASRQWLNPNDT